jgi:DeoR/GlpR family transcriptional regulator of sugar metabolism
MTSAKASLPRQGGEARRTAILEMIEAQGHCTTAELSDALRVSEMTVRRDIAKLAGEKGLRSVHGGVTALPPTALTGSNFLLRVDKMAEIKRQIASAAIEFISPSGIIAIDAGTTTADLTTVLPSDRRLSVVSNSLPVLTGLATSTNVEVIGLGGVFHLESQSFAGPTTVRAIADLQIGTFFLGASGVNERGVFCGNDFDAATKRALIDVSDHVVLLCDSSKFDVTAMARVAALSSVDILVTDSGLSAWHLSVLEDQGVMVRLVPSGD